MSKGKENNNVFGVFNDEEILISAIKNIHKSGIKIKNVFMPYPVHEVFHELRLTTRFPYFAFLFGVFGAISTFAFLYWSSVIDFPIVVGGKPPFSYAFIIVTFVMTINFGVLLSLLAFFGIQRLFPGKKAGVVHPGITDDKFVIVIEKKKEMTTDEADGITDLLLKYGATETGMKDNIGTI